MKRFVLKAVLLVTTLTVTTVHTFGDLKSFRGGSSRINSSPGTSKISGGTFRSPNNLGNGIKSGNGVQLGNGSFNGGGNMTSGKPFDARVTTPRPKLPNLNNGNVSGVGNGNQNGGTKGGTPIVRLPGTVTMPGKITAPGKITVPGKITLPNGNGGAANGEISGNGLSGIKLPINLGNGGGKQSPPNLIQLGNGKTAKPIGLNPGLVLQSKFKAPQVQAQVQQIVATAPKHLCGHPHFHWWVSVCHIHCHTHYGCWNIYDHYWDCWTPCTWNVVQCQQLSWYVGMSCIYIPDMQAYGIQSITEGSPAHLAGLLPGDLILTVNGQSVFDPNLVNTEVARGRLELTIVRDGFDTPLSSTILPRLVTAVSY